MKKTKIFVLIISLFLLSGCKNNISNQPEETHVENQIKNKIVENVDSDEDTVLGKIADTGQKKCFNERSQISCPKSGESFYGQDAQYEVNEPRYRDNSDGTVTDLNTGLMWVKSTGEKESYDELIDRAASFSYAGYTDWRIPNI